MIVSIVSVVEAKPLVLMLARGLSLENKVLILTNDITYKRIGNKIEADEMFRRIENIDVNIMLDAEEKLKNATDVEDKANELYEVTFEKYEAIIVITTSAFVDGADCRVYCEGNDSKWRSELITSEIHKFEDLKQSLDNESDVSDKDKVIEIILTSNASVVKDKSKCVVSMDANTMIQLMSIEEKHQMEIFKNKMLLGCICKMIAPVLGIDGIKMDKMIKRKAIITEKEVK